MMEPLNHCATIINSAICLIAHQLDRKTAGFGILAAAGSETFGAALGEVQIRIHLAIAHLAEPFAFVIFEPVVGHRGILHFVRRLPPSVPPLCTARRAMQGGNLAPLAIFPLTPAQACVTVCLSAADGAAPLEDAPVTYNTPITCAEYEMRFAAVLVGAGIPEHEALDIAAQRYLSADPEADAAEWLDAEV